MLIEPDLAASIAFLVIDKNKKLDRWMRWCDMSLRTPAETTAKGGELVMHKFLIASSAIAIALAARPAMAQDDAGQEEDGLVDVALAEEAEEQRQPGGLNVITVTAQRREETLQDAAIAINAASGEELMRAGVTDATGLNKVAPSLYVTTGGGANAAYFLRGVGNFTNNGFTSPAIAFNLDGVYIGRPTSTTASFLDVNRVEVLKGPQGTLYGRNATGGAINVIPNAPRLGEFSGSVSAKYGNYDAYELTGVLNAPLGDSVAVRLAGSVNGHDAYFDDGTETAEDLALRAQIFAELGEAVNVRLSADYSTQTGTGPGLNVDGIFRFQPFSPDLPVPNWNFVPAPEDVRAEYTGLHTPETLAFIGNNVAAAPLFTPYVGYVFPFRDDEYWGVNAELNFELGGVDLVVIPAYRRSELDNQFNGPPFKAAINQDVAEQYSFEARLSGEAGPIDWILGGYYFDERVRGQGTFNQFSTTANITFDSQIESLAFFGRGTFNVTDDLRLVGGLRYTDERREFDGENIGTAGICLDEPPAGPPMCFNLPTLPVGLTIADMLGAIDPALFPAFNPVNALPLQGPIVVPYGPIGPMGPGALLSVVPTRVDQAGSDEEVTYRLAVEYDVTPDNLLYASFETGFRAGGFNIVVGQESYDPEFIDAWTIGSKNSFFDNRLQVNFEAFYWEYSGQQLAALGLDANGRNAFFTRNVGESSIKGAEVDFQVLATETTLIRGGVQYLDATYDSFGFDQVDLSDATDPPNFLTPVTGCDFTQNLAPVRNFDIDCSGRPAINAPKWTLSLGVEQTVELGDLELTAAVDSRYRSNRVLGFNYLPTGGSGDDLKIDAFVRLAPYSEGWSIMAFVRNLTDQAVRSTYQLGSGNVASSAYEPPRTYGVRVGYEF